MSCTCPHEAYGRAVCGNSRPNTVGGDDTRANEGSVESGSREESRLCDQESREMKTESSKGSWRTHSPYK